MVELLPHVGVEQGLVALPGELARLLGRQLPSVSSSWPRLGASTGTIMKTIIAVDMICAMAAPW